MNKIFYSNKLNMNYKIKYDFMNNKIVVFEDDVNYNQEEMEKLKNVSNDNLRLAHEIKKIFKGVIV